MQREVRTDVALFLIIVLSVVVGYAAILTNGYIQRVSENIASASVKQAEANAELRNRHKAGVAGSSSFDKSDPLP